MKVEFHDNDINNLREGTHSGTAGGQEGIDYPYQVEMWVQDTLPESWGHRAFCLSGTTVLAVWGKNNGTLCYVGTRGWQGEWQLPYLYNKRGLASITTDELNGQAPEEWAKEVLQQAACAILVQPRGKHHVYAAWELLEGVVTLVARAPDVEANCLVGG